MRIFKGLQDLEKAQTQICSHFVCTVYNFDKSVFIKEDFSSLIEWDFEGIRTYISVGYDRILTTKYGDYHSFPPVEQRGQWHGDAWFYTDDS